MIMFEFRFLYTKKYFKFQEKPQVDTPVFLRRGLEKGNYEKKVLPVFSESFLGLVLAGSCKFGKFSTSKKKWHFK